MLPIPQRIWTDVSMDSLLDFPCVVKAIYALDRLSQCANFMPCSASLTGEGVPKLLANLPERYVYFRNIIIADGGDGGG